MRAISAADDVARNALMTEPPCVQRHEVTRDAEAAATAARIRPHTALQIKVLYLLLLYMNTRL